MVSTSIRGRGGSAFSGHHTCIGKTNPSPHGRNERNRRGRLSRRDSVRAQNHLQSSKRKSESPELLSPLLEGCVGSHLIVNSSSSQARASRSCGRWKPSRPQTRPATGERTGPPIRATRLAQRKLAKPRPGAPPRWLCRARGWKLFQDSRKKVGRGVGSLVHISIVLQIR
jgi:hypothetical protein